MSATFHETTDKLKNIIDGLDNKREYEFHFNSADGADAVSYTHLTLPTTPYV